MDQSTDTFLEVTELEDVQANYISSFDEPTEEVRF
jgi:hypothetical protein